MRLQKLQISPMSKRHGHWNFFPTKGCEAYWATFPRKCEEGAGSLGLHVMILTVSLNKCWPSKTTKRLKMQSLEFSVQVLQKISAGLISWIFQSFWLLFLILGTSFSCTFLNIKALVLPCSPGSSSNANTPIVNVFVRFFAWKHSNGSKRNPCLWRSLIL